MAGAVVFASIGLSLNTPRQAGHLLVADDPHPHEHEECVDGALPLAKSCWMGDHLSAAVAALLAPRR